MPVSVLFPIVCFVLALFGMLVFGGCMVLVMLLMGGGTVVALNSASQEPINTDKRAGLIKRFGVGVVSVAMVGIGGFGLAFVSILGFILSIIVNLVIWIPVIFNSFG